MVLSFVNDGVSCNLILFQYFAGEIQLPALLQEGHHVIDALGLDEYEVSTCEPLHDLKNVNSIIFEELHHHVKDEPLRRSIKEFCSQFTGM